RAMFATVIGRLYERSFGEIATSSTHGFIDCDYNVYYGKYVDWAAENEIVAGVGGSKFAPDINITREQMAAILYRFAAFLGILPSEMDDTLEYSDAANISSYAGDAVLYCQTNGIFEEKTDGVFAPQETATRAKVTAIIKRFIETVIK
ncbi:MAG: S-layer homology domain-containing protein, partial [Clostridiaceae bacterium]|nr:S-layer homology domain-containing protein [Clostridiaceae bacterium]